MNPLRSVNLTQAEYDALPESEKLNGTYYNVTDDSPPPYQLYLDVAMPVGFVYEQLPPTIDEDGIERTPLDPNTLFNNGYVHSVWKRLDYDGAFFRAEGDSALPFGTGVQSEGIPDITGTTGGVIGGQYNTGAFSSSSKSWTLPSGSGYVFVTTDFKASKSETKTDGTIRETAEVYGKSDHVTPRNYTKIEWIRVE